MRTYFKHGDGKMTIETVARWLIQEAAFRGWSLHDYVEGRCSLTDLGVTAENVIATLKPLILDAHLHYNRDTPRGKRFDSWEAWFQHRLRNRIYYFFHRHTEGGGLRLCWAEWPLPIPERPRMPMAMAAE
jgi:hypothetical protein